MPALLLVNLVLMGCVAGLLTPCVACWVQGWRKWGLVVALTLATEALFLWSFPALWGRE